VFDEVGFGEAKLPQHSIFLVIVAGKAGNDHQEQMIIRGSVTL
jgi:hypothetical protein